MRRVCSPNGTRAATNTRVRAVSAAALLAAARHNAALSQPSLGFASHHTDAGIPTNRRSPGERTPARPKCASLPGLPTPTGSQPLRVHTSSQMLADGAAPLLPRQPQPGRATTSARDGGGGKHWSSCCGFSVADAATDGVVHLSKRDRARGRAKLTLARLCFFLAAFALFTFGDSMDSIALTVLVKTNITTFTTHTAAAAAAAAAAASSAAADVLPSYYADMEIFKLVGVCLGCLCSGLAHDVLRPAAVPLVGVVLVALGTVFNALHVMWFSVASSAWSLPLVRSVCGVGIGCLYVAAAMLTAHCGLLLALPRELAVTSFWYGAGAVAAVVLHVLVQQAACNAVAADCSITSLCLMWLVDSLVVLAPAIATVVFVTLLWGELGERALQEQHYVALARGQPSSQQRLAGGASKILRVGHATTTLTIATTTTPPNMTSTTFAATANGDASTGRSATQEQPKQASSSTVLLPALRPVVRRTARPSAGTLRAGAGAL